MLNYEHKKLIEEADILVGGDRHLSFLPEATCEKRVIDRNLSSVVAFIKGRMEESRIVVLASGDPLRKIQVAYSGCSICPEDMYVLQVFSVESWVDFREPWDQFPQAPFSSDSSSRFPGRPDSPGKMHHLVLRRRSYDCLNPRAISCRCRRRFFSIDLPANPPAGQGILA